RRRRTSWAPGRSRSTGSRRPARDRRATCPAGIGAGSRWPAPRLARTTRPDAWCSSRTSRLRRGLLDRGTDPRVGPAAADVAFHGLVDLRVGGIRVALQQRGGRHDLPGLAVAALRDAVVDPGRLQRAADGLGADRFDRDDLAVRNRRDRRDARAHSLAVHVNGAGAAERHAAAELAARQPELVPQRPQQRGLAGYVDVLAFAVDVE